MSDLTMRHFLEVVRDHRTFACDVLIQEGFHPKVVYAKALKASSKGYTNYGTVADRPWLEPAGAAFLEVRGEVTR